MPAWFFSRKKEFVRRCGLPRLTLSKTVVLVEKEIIFYTMYMKLILCFQARVYPSLRFNYKTAKNVFIKYGAGFNI